MGSLGMSQNKQFFDSNFKKTVLMGKNRADTKKKLVKLLTIC